MERGEAVTVLGIVTVVGILATTTLLFTPTGQLFQGEPWHPPAMTETPVECQGMPVYLSTQGKFNTYCCQEHLIDENTCRQPQHVYVT
ncbi:hypothetical protein HY489_03615 [Candidatus Woesearchaeota archaeon]|nr:hypothetical protein [Candidatus Woesearchaeota archaeon]